MVLKLSSCKGELNQDYRVLIYCEQRQTFVNRARQNAEDFIKQSSCYPERFSSEIWGKSP